MYMSQILFLINQKCLEEEIFDQKKKKHTVRANLFRKYDSSHHNRFVWVLVVAVFICKDLGRCKITFYFDELEVLYKVISDYLWFRFW